MHYFSIYGKQSGKVLDASMSNISEVVLWEFNGQDNQFWFWDGEMLRNKMFPSQVLDFHWSDYQKNSWGKVYLHNENGGLNQRWSLRGEEIICRYGQHQNLRLLLDVHSSSTQNGAKVGCYSSTGGVNQKWIISNVFSSNTRRSSYQNFGSYNQDKFGLVFDRFNSEGNTTKK